MTTLRDDDHLRLNFISDFIEEFVTPSSRERLHYLLSRPKRRHEIPGYFHSDTHLDDRYMYPLVPLDQNADRIYRMMQALGAPSRCFVLSMEEAYKDQVSLKQALNEHVGQGTMTTGAILYCREAKLAYWDGHDGKRYLLHKKDK